MKERLGIQEEKVVPEGPEGVAALDAGWTQTGAQDIAQGGLTVSSRLVGHIHSKTLGEANGTHGGTIKWKLKGKLLKQPVFHPS